MPQISATDRPIIWAVGNPVVEAGITPTGATTVSALPMISDTSETAFLAATVGMAGGYDSLPDQGEWCKAGTIYAHNDNLVIVRRSHARTEHNPADVPALFAVYRENAGDVLAWVAGEQVLAGTRRMYEDVEYECLQPHQTQSDWYPSAPGILGTLWGEVSQTDQWSIGVNYKVGAHVMHEGNEYVCLQAHTSIATWSPTSPGILGVLWALAE